MASVNAAAPSRATLDCSFTISVRTGCRNLRRLGAHEKTIMKIGGWKTRSVFDRYNVVDAKELLLLDLIAKRSSESCRTVVAQ